MSSYFAAVAIAIAVLCSSCVSSGLTSRRWTSGPDASLESEIYNRLQNDSSVRFSALAVEVTNGVATVYGTVGSPSDRARALAVVKSTEGVKEVIDHLR